MLLIAFGLAAVYISQSLIFIATGTLPAIIAKTGHVTHIVFALDFLFVIPLFVAGAILLWRRTVSGYVLAVIANTMGFIYMLALSSATVSIFRHGASDNISELWLWGPIGMGCLFASIRLVSYFSNASKMQSQ
jgi:hypothetical protein